MAATTVISCPACQKKFKGRSDLQGKKVRCPSCQHTFLVEAMATDQVGADEQPAKARAATVAPPKPPPMPKAPTKPAAKPKPPPPPSKPVDDDDEEGGENPYGVTELDLAPRCPHCAEEMESADAVICLFCGYNTLTREIGHTSTVIAATGGEQFMWLLPGILNALSVVFLTVFCLWFSLALPEMSKGTKVAFLDHESMRMWATLIALAGMWPAGFFAYKRLIMEPRPPEKKKD
jgi:hypothetical protein